MVLKELFLPQKANKNNGARTDKEQAHKVITANKNKLRIMICFGSIE